jgi:hypothetical protein
MSNPSAQPQPPSPSIQHHSTSTLTPMYTDTLNSYLLPKSSLRAGVPNPNSVTPRTRSRTGRALPPRNMQLLRKRYRRIIIAHLTRLIRLLIRKRNPVVDVQDTVLAARRPDGSRRLHTILLRVDLAVEQRAAADGCHAGGLRLAGVLAEVVGRDEVSGYAFVETSPPVVGSIHDGVLETARVLEVEVQLAVFGAVGGGRARADVCLELVEAVSDDLRVCEWVVLTVATRQCCGGM